MKYLIIIIFLMGTLNGLAQQNIILSTYNIRLDVASDAPNNWDNRKEHLASVVLFNKVEILGVQEALHHQMLDLKSLLKDYQWVGVGRDDGAEKGEYSAIFYRQDLYNLVSGGTFWLSETPDKPSKAWDAALPRVCTWAILEQKSSARKLLVLNTHFDHIGKTAREESAKLILKKAEELNTDKLPLVMMGDLNATAEEEPIKVFSENLKNSVELAKYKMLASGTFNAFKWAETPSNVIDYVFVNGQWDVLRHGVITQSDQQRYPSDHFPVLVELSWK